MQVGKDGCETPGGVNDETYWVCVGIDQERDNGSAIQRSARGWRSPPQARGLGVTPAQLVRPSLDPRPRASERRGSHELAVVSHESAAALHGIGNLDADVYELTLGGHRTVRSGPSPGPPPPANAQPDWTVNAPGMIG